MECSKCIGTTENYAPITRYLMAGNMGLRVLKTVFRYGVIAVAISLLLSSCKPAAPKVPYYNSADLTPLWLTEAPDTLHTIAPFKVTDQSGTTITNRYFANKLYVANFFFTSCPSICPKMIKNMKLVADSFRHNEQVKFISYSVTPEIDSVARLAAYAKRFGIDEKQWKLVTGNRNDIYRLARQSYFAEEESGFNADSTEFLHTEHLLLVDGKGHLRGVYNGTVALDMEKLETDIHNLLQE